MDHAATMRSTYERINKGDIAGFGDLVADDFVEHQGLPDLPTKEGTLEFFRILLAAFPDMRMTVEDLIASGDKVMARVRATGTPRGEFMGVPPAGALGAAAHRHHEVRRRRLGARAVARRGHAVADAAARRGARSPSGAVLVGRSGRAPGRPFA